MTPVGFEPTPFRNGALSHRLRPLGQSVHVVCGQVILLRGPANGKGILSPDHICRVTCLCNFVSVRCRVCVSVVVPYVSSASYR